MTDKQGHDGVMMEEYEMFFVFKKDTRAACVEQARQEAQSLSSALLDDSAYDILDFGGLVVREK